jgi:hypothetical protein
MELRTREQQVNTARCMGCVATCRICPRACLHVNYRDAQNYDDGESEPEYGAAATEEGETTDSDSELNAAFTDEEKDLFLLVNWRFGGQSGVGRAQNSRVFRDAPRGLDFHR